MIGGSKVRNFLAFLPVAPRTQYFFCLSRFEEMVEKGEEMVERAEVNIEKDWVKTEKAAGRRRNCSGFLSV